MDVFLFSLAMCTIYFNSLYCTCDTYRIGKRENGDAIILKKVLLSVPTSTPTNHTVIYEYKATKAVSCIEYQVENISDNEKVAADIAFTGEYSLEAKFNIFNITELVIVMSIYGFDQFNIPLDFQPILVPQFLVTEDNDTPKFGLGFRRENDELIYFCTQTSIRTNVATNHSLRFSAEMDHFITYVSFSVDSKTAGATFLLMSDHVFRGIVYDLNTHILFANMYVYGFKKEKLPVDYESMFPWPNVSGIAVMTFDGNEEIVLKGSYRRNNALTFEGQDSSKCFAAINWMYYVAIIAMVQFISFFMYLTHSY